MSEKFYIVPAEKHNELVNKAYQNRGYTAEEAAQAARFSELASRHGIRTHNAIKALHLDHLFGSTVGGCIPGARIQKINSRFVACDIWNANKKN